MLSQHLLIGAYDFPFIECLKMVPYSQKKNFKKERKETPPQISQNQGQGHDWTHSLLTKFLNLHLIYEYLFPTLHFPSN
jgi:hypothetical protein